MVWYGERVEVVTDLVLGVMTLIQKSLNLLHFDSLFQTSFAARLDEQNNQPLYHEPKQSGVLCGLN